MDPGFQLNPPSVETSTVPVPATQTRLASRAKTLPKDDQVLDIWLVQLSPPFRDFKIVPPEPTTHPVLLSVNATSPSVAVTPLV